MLRVLSGYSCVKMNGRIRLTISPEQSTNDWEHNSHIHKCYYGINMRGEACARGAYLYIIIYEYLLCKSFVMIAGRKYVIIILGTSMRNYVNIGFQG